jgi:hypothetical protein
MKIVRFILVLFSFILVFGACTTDVDLYADYKDTAIIYAMLNYKTDTNYVKITRAFCGTNDNPINANEVALIYDSSNYDEKLDVRLYEYKSTHGNYYEPTNRELILDTLTIHNKEEGVFYSPDQLVYYISEPLHTGTNRHNYRYRLVAVKPDGDTITALTTMVGGEDFAIVSGATNFQLEETNAMGNVLFRTDGVAGVYELKMQFNYREQHNGQEMKWKSVSRSFGTKPLSEFQKVDNTENSYYETYSLNWLFNALASAIGNDTVVNPNHPNVVRYADDFVITLSAAGEELYYYYLANEAQQSSYAGLFTAYSNIVGGYGLFSSRTTINKTMRLSSTARRDLYGKQSWGFREQ